MFVLCCAVDPIRKTPDVVDQTPARAAIGALPRRRRIPNAKGADSAGPGVEETRVSRLTPARDSRARLLLGYSPGWYFRVMAPIPAATLRPVVPSTLSGCREMVLPDPPTRTFAPAPTPTETPAVAPA